MKDIKDFIIEANYQQNYWQIKTGDTIYGFIVFWSEGRKSGEIEVIKFDNFEEYLDYVDGSDIKQFGFDLEKLEVGESYKAKDGACYMRIW
jgi:hypothetical protein